MNSPAFPGRVTPFSTLRRFAQPQMDTELCEFCSLQLASQHRHLVEVATRKIVCVCDACGLRFDNAVGRWKLVPRDSWRLPALEISDAEWNSFGLPIELAFFVHSTPAEKMIALYPSPGGAIESSVPIANWQPIADRNLRVAKMQPDAESLLANRLAGARDYYVTPIDVCFELAGLIRLHWRGFSGGDRVWNEIRTFFERLGESARIDENKIPEACHA
jgi:Family of unknown function (DUF5947)